MTPQELAALQWTALPPGNDIVVKASYFYAALASVSKGQSSDAIKAKASSLGLVIEDWKEQGDAGFQPVDPNTDHRYIHVIATASKDGGTIPWKSPWPTTIFSIVKAWYSPPSGGGSAPTAAPATNVLAWGIGIAAVAGAAYGGWWLYRSRRRR